MSEAYSLNATDGVFLGSSILRNAVSVIPCIEAHLASVYMRSVSCLNRFGVHESVGSAPAVEELYLLTIHALEFFG